MNFDKESRSDFFLWWEGGGVGGATAIQYNTRKQPFTQCTACGTINIWKYVNNSNFELSSK